MSADLSPAAVESRLQRAGELHRLAVSLRDVHTAYGVEVPVFAVVLRALVRRFGEVHDLTATPAWTSAVCWALVDVRAEIARSVGLVADDLDLRCTDTQHPYDFVWVVRSDQKRLLAAESEWGAKADEGTNDARVREDFAKLTDARCSARYRLLVYSYHPSSVDRLEEDLARMARAAPSAPYLFVGLPWEFDGPVHPRLHAWSLRPQGTTLLRERLTTPIG